MDSTTSTRDGHSLEEGELAPTEIFDVLASDRRRYVLHYLDQRVGGVSLGELAEQIAIWEDDPTYEHYERVLTSLLHVHFPKLTDAALLSYERDTETVTSREAAEQLRPYLDLAMPGDVQ